jgi:hypothetical protein
MVIDGRMPAASDPHGKQVEVCRFVVAERMRESLDGPEMHEVGETRFQEDRHVRRPDVPEDGSGEHCKDNQSAERHR